MITSRRGLLAGSAAMATGAIAGCALPAGASRTQATPFDVAASTIPIVGSEQVYPVRRIYCIGRNYEAHAREMGSDPSREPPFFFQKPADAVQVVTPGVVADHPYPSLTKNYHYEVELVVALAKGGRNIPASSALDYVYGYSLGLDMTRRDLQREMGDQKKPWEIGKSFDHSAPIGPIHPVAKVGHFTDGAIWLKVNGQVKQQGDLNMQIWSLPEQINYLSNLITLQPGDLIFSGTPAGVGPIKAGDKLEGHVDGVGDLVVTYKA